MTATVNATLTAAPYETSNGVRGLTFTAVIDGETLRPCYVTYDVSLAGFMTWAGSDHDRFERLFAGLPAAEQSRLRTEAAELVAAESRRLRSIDPGEEP